MASAKRQTKPKKEKMEDETESKAEIADENLKEVSGKEASEEMFGETLEEAEDKLEDDIKLAEKKAAENWELLLRTKAEMENLRKRTQKDLENAHKFAIEKFIAELIPIKDSMELGLASEEVSAESLLEGTKLTMSMLNSTFEKFNIEEIDPMDQKFDPEHHQAMSMQASEDVEPNTVVAVMQKGYKLNGRLVRPAMVMVSKAPD